MDNKRAVGRLRLAIADANRVLAEPDAAPASPWVTRPPTGWTDATLPSTYGTRWMITQDSALTGRIDVKLWRNPNEINPSWWEFVDAYMFVDPPAWTRRADAEGGAE